MRPDPQRHSQVAAKFRQLYQTEPTLWCRAPGRVDLMGSHTDYNLGRVLTLPLGLDTWIAAAPRADREVRVHSMNLAGEARFNLDWLGRADDRHWSTYVRGVAAVLTQENLETRGFDGVIHSTVPMGSGLSSSAALECAVATVFEQLSAWRLAPGRKATLCQRAENHFVGVNCGILDQYTSCAGKAGCALLLDCRDLSSRPVRIPADLSVVICDTRYKRELARSQYGRRRAQCEEGARRLGLGALREISVKDFKTRAGELPAEVAKRCRFIVEENERVGQFAQALEDDEPRRIRQLCAESFQGALDLYHIGVPAMESMMQAMLGAPGVIGARQAGAGFGGCMVAFVRRARVPEFTGAVHAGYERLSGRKPEIHVAEAAAGAGLLEG